MERGEVTVRKAGIDDAASAASLLAELGYPSDPDDVAARIATTSTRERDCVFIAVDGVVPIGLASVHLIPLFHRSSSVARVTAFVVSTSARRRGVGSVLLRACEAFAIEHRAERLEITSGDLRADAHAFYVHRGLQREGVRFSKVLSPTG